MQNEKICSKENFYFKQYMPIIIYISMLFKFSHWNNKLKKELLFAYKTYLTPISVWALLNSNANWKMCAEKWSFLVFACVRNTDKSPFAIFPCFKKNLDGKNAILQKGI